MIHSQKEMKELEEEQRAIEEDRHRYDDLLPDLNSPGGRASAAEHRNDKPWPALPQGCKIGLNIRATPSAVVPPGRPVDVADEADEYVVCEDLDAGTARPVDWLWPGRIPLGKLTLVVGDPNVGKSFLLLDLAARLSRGAGWPDRPGEKGRRGTVVLLSAEDSGPDTIAPRLAAANAEPRHIIRLRFLTGKGHNSRGRACQWQRPIVLPDDLAALESVVWVHNSDLVPPPPPNPSISLPSALSMPTETAAAPLRRLHPDDWPVPPVRLVVLDPLVAFMPRAGSNDNAYVRQALQPLADLAERYQVAIVGIHHLNKSSAQTALYRPTGSLAFTAMARAVWGLARDPDNVDRRLLLPVKMNVGEPPRGLAFRIRDRRVAWDSAPEERDWNAVANASAGAFWHERNEAIEFLREALAGGPVPTGELQKLARAAGISLATLRRARTALGLRKIYRRNDTERCWLWEMP